MLWDFSRQGRRMYGASYGDLIFSIYLLPLLHTNIYMSTKIATKSENDKIMQAQRGIWNKIIKWNFVMLFIFCKISTKEKLFGFWKWSVYQIIRSQTYIYIYCNLCLCNIWSCLWNITILIMFWCMIGYCYRGILSFKEN